MKTEKEIRKSVFRKSPIRKKKAECAYCGFLHETMTCPVEVAELWADSHESNESIAKMIDRRIIMERKNTIEEVFSELKKLDSLNCTEKSKGLKRVESKGSVLSNFASTSLIKSLKLPSEMPSEKRKKGMK